MRIRTIMAATVVGGGMARATAGMAAAQPPGDRNCPDFSTQAAAQTYFNTTVNDSDRLDRDDDGVACEDHDYVSTPPVHDEDEDDGVTPSGSIEAGAGGTADDGAALLPLGLIGGGALAAGAGVLMIRRGAPRG